MMKANDKSHGLRKGKVRLCTVQSCYGFSLNWLAAIDENISISKIQSVIYGVTVYTVTLTVLED